jgi:DNA-binding NarL/FixJ family response regulator
MINLKLHNNYHFMQKQVIICDQQKLYALGCGMLLKDHYLVKDCQYHESLPSLHEYSNAANESLMIIDSQLLQFGVPETVAKIRALQKQIPIIVIYDHQDDMQLYKIIDNGISVVVSRKISKEELLKAIEMAVLDKIYFCAAIAKKLFTITSIVDKIKLKEEVDGLTMSDKYILIRICDEASSKQIAAEIGFSKRTVEGHRTKLMQQFEVKNVAGLVKITLLTKLYENYLSNPGLYDVTLCAKTSCL